MDIDKLYPAIKRYVEAVEELTGRTCHTFEFEVNTVNLAFELTIYFMDGGKPLWTLLPDNEEEIEWKTQRLLVTARNIDAQFSYIPWITTREDIYKSAGLSAIDTVTAQPEPSWVELETMKELV